jgi:hypothetical protein
MLLGAFSSPLVFAIACRSLLAFEVCALLCGIVSSSHNRRGRIDAAEVEF